MSTVTKYNRISFHAGINCECAGIEEYWTQEARAGRPVVAKSSDDPGLAIRAAQIASEHSAPAEILMRFTNPNGRGNDHPERNLEPQDAAAELWEDVAAELRRHEQAARENGSPALQDYKDLIQLEPTNEIVAQGPGASWVGYFMVALARHANADGWRVALSGFNAGQPEPEDWQRPGMEEYLHYCAEHPDIAAISLHEAVLGDPEDEEQPQDSFPWYTGRFTFLLDACDKMGLPYPRIYVSEWAWSYNYMPGSAKAWEDIKWLSDFYGRYPAVRGVYLWNLQNDPKWSGLAGSLSGMIPAVIKLAATYPEHQHNDEEGEGGVPGVFVSDEQGEMDWGTAASLNVGYAFVKTTGGALHVDDQARNNMIRSESNGVHPIPMHYYRPENDPLVQASHFLSSGWVMDTDHKRAAVDVEEAGTNPERLLIMLQKLEDVTGQPPIIYTSPGFFNEWLAPYAEELAHYPLWVAHWGTVEPIVPGAWDEWTFWQPSCDGSGSAYGAESARICLDRFNGTIEELEAFLQPPQSLAEALWEKSLEMQVISLNPDAALQSEAASQMTTFCPVSSEGRLAHGGRNYALQPFEHLHSSQRRVYYTEVGDWGNVDYISSPDDVIDEEPEPDPDPEPQGIDLLPYLRGDGRSYELQYTWDGGGTHPVQTQRDPNHDNVWYIVKGGGEYEELWYNADDGLIYRGVDTSPSPDEYYIQFTDVDGRERPLYGHPWVKRYMQVGETFVKNPRVTFFRESDCAPIRTYTSHDELTLARHYDSYHFTESDIVVEDVIFLEWQQGEGYLFARGPGLVGFVFSGGQSYYIGDHASQRTLERDVPHCLQRPETIQ